MGWVHQSDGSCRQCCAWSGLQSSSRAWAQGGLHHAQSGPQRTSLLGKPFQGWAGCAANVHILGQYAVLHAAASSLPGQYTCPGYAHCPSADQVPVLHAGPAVRQLATAPCLDLGLTKAAAETQRQPYSTVMQAATGVFVAATCGPNRRQQPRWQRSCRKYSCYQLLGHLAGRTQGRTGLNPLNLRRRHACTGHKPPRQPPCPDDGMQALPTACAPGKQQPAGAVIWLALYVAVQFCV